ncbi:TPM domain-containing protein [Flavobacterium chungbukense]|uniref:TPM domain-containing protein n=1 Tax=Flavobacterium chungbukense TaxID=877464 RepID=A0ABP7YU11_9FLAO|nr:TPM domain-containing protein [Flavobacterium chungbukense]MCC4923124.1 TPM domain-containing protein [Flavobacterium chungbukense]
MKKYTVLFFLLLVTIGATGQTNKKLKTNSTKENLTEYRQIFWNNLPKRVNWTTDYEGIFSDAEEEKLNNLISNFEKETSMEIAIVTIDTIKVAKENFDDLSLHIAKTWAVGKKGKDNGILIGFSKEYRKIRIELGDGTIKILSEKETKEIIENNFIPEFLKGSYYQGILNGTTKLMEVLRMKIKQ